MKLPRVEISRPVRVFLNALGFVGAVSLVNAVTNDPNQFEAQLFLGALKGVGVLYSGGLIGLSVMAVRDRFSGRATVKQAIAALDWRIKQFEPVKPYL